MTWAMLYMVCFLAGVALSVLALAGGSLHLPHMHPHLPHGHAGLPHGSAVRGEGIHAETGRGSDIPWLNFATMTAFLTWFGGTGFLLTRYSTIVVALILLAAVGAGIAGAAAIFAAVVKPLLRHDQPLDPADYERVGVLGRVSSGIGAGGTGEIMFSLGGTRQTCGARCENGEGLARGTEVVITRYEHGIAYVRRWDEMLDGKQMDSHSANGKSD
jgi:membrane protein implicated in regulation of membrane protease activity